MPVFIRTAAELTELAVRLMSAQAIAIDTEFHGERTYRPRPMLIQLCADDGEVWLVDANADLPLRTLGPVLSSRRLILHGADADLEILRRVAGVTPLEVYDTQIAAGFCGFGYPVRLSDLTEALLGLRMTKTETVSDWSRRPLSPDQLEYAAMDVRVLAGLERALVARMPDELRGACRACMSEYVELSLSDADPDTLWGAIPGAWTLRPGARAILRRLVAWRDAMARDRDTPRHAIVTDTHLLDLARRRPTSFEDLRKNRRLPSAFVKGWGAEVLSVIAENDPRPPPEPLASKAATDLLMAAARTIEHDLGAAAELLLPTRLHAATLAGARLTGWREDVVESPLRDFLEGRTALTFGGGWIKIVEKRP